jgi:hypothetical protein
MPRLSVLFTFVLCTLFSAPFAAAADRPDAPAAAAAVPLDLFTVTGIKVDATAESASIARDLAMAQGRPQAWTELFHRLAAPAAWPRQPDLQGNALLRLIRGYEVVNERRSTTRYLADVTVHFNPAAVRRALRQANIPFTEARAHPALVIPLLAGTPGFDPMSPWAKAWSAPALQSGLVPTILPTDGSDIPADLAQADWAALEGLAKRYDAGQIVVATASADAKTVQVVQISPTGRAAYSFAYANTTFDNDAAAVADRLNDAWKTRSAVDFALRGHLTADVQFDSLADWAKIRSSLGAVKAVAGLDVVGLALHEAQVDLTYFGRPEQLRDAIAQQNLALAGTGGNYTLQIGASTAANTP